jgi:hypothetical protein
MTAGLPWVYDDGGRRAAGFTGHAGDCVTRAIAIATGLDYREVYDDLFERARAHNARRRKANRRGSVSPRSGVMRKAYEPFLVERGWLWVPTMSIGSGTTVHLRSGELPTGRIIASVSRHVCAVVDGVIHDTHDPSREGTRAVYGYYARPS